MSEKKRILVIEDDKVVLEGFRKTLELEGYTVDAVETGKEAVEKSNKATYNLALIDIRLPDMEGTQLLTAMRERVPKMVKIIVTGYPSQENAVEAVNKGADGYIIKPVLNMDEFLKTIRDHLRRQQEERKYSEEKVKEFIEARAEEYEAKTSAKHKPKK
ncbi:MAG: response regulator [Candidatus Bathyarchaeia archaeon]